MERRAPQSGNLRQTGLKSHPKTASDDAPMWERSSALGAAGAGSCAARGGDQVSSATRGGQCCQPLGPFKIPRVPPTLAGLLRARILYRANSALDLRVGALAGLRQNSSVDVLWVPVETKTSSCLLRDS